MVVMTACVMSVVGWEVVAWGGVVQLRSFFFTFYASFPRLTHEEGRNMWRATAEELR